MTRGVLWAVFAISLVAGMLLSIRCNFHDDPHGAILMLGWAILAKLFYNDFSEWDQ